MMVMIIKIVMMMMVNDVGSGDFHYDCDAVMGYEKL